MILHVLLDLSIVTYYLILTSSDQCFESHGVVLSSGPSLVTYQLHWPQSQSCAVTQVIVVRRENYCILSCGGTIDQSEVGICNSNVVHTHVGIEVTYKKL